MNEPSIIALEDHKRRGRRLNRAIAARARLRALDGPAPRENRAPGRAWINGREVGGTDPLYRHLSESYD